MTRGYAVFSYNTDMTSAAVAALSPSLAETFGITQVEAMACGTPLVAADIPVAREICGEAALLAPPTDVGAIAEALDRVLADASLRAGLSRNGIERSREFTWDRTAMRLHEEVLRRLEELRRGAGKAPTV